jgi:hypothetical protein
MPLGLYEQESFRARASTPATVATLATQAQLFLKNNGLLVCCAQNVVATVTRQLRQVGFTLVLVGVVLLAKDFEGRANMAGSHHRDVGLYCGVVWAVRRQGRMKNPGKAGKLAFAAGLRTICHAFMSRRRVWLGINQPCPTRISAR